MPTKEFDVVRVRNISNFVFNGDPARYHGVAFELAPGEAKLFPYHAGKHLARSLARQIMLRKAPIRDGKETDGKGSDRPLWDDQVIGDLMAKIMTDSYSEEKPSAVSEEEKLKQKVSELNKAERAHEQEVSGGNAPFDGVPTEGNSGDIVYKDKAQVIAELEKRGKRFDARAKKSTLEEMLKS
jgi:hypothetical protein